MGKIENDFIEEAAHPEILLAAIRKRRRMMLLKRISSIAACVSIAVGIVFAIPILRLTSSTDNDESLIMDAVNNASQSKDEIQMEGTLASDILSPEDADADQMSQAEASIIASASKALEEAEKNALEASISASKAIAEAEKAAAEASKAAAEASKAAASVASSLTAGASNPESESENTPVLKNVRIGQIEYFYSDQVLFSLSVDTNYRLTFLEIPAELNGEPIGELAEDFWLFCDSNSNLEQVKIPNTITQFGNVSYLNKHVEIVCDKGSAAESYFQSQGYTVKLP
jgi:hypothetical protein